MGQHSFLTSIFANRVPASYKTPPSASMVPEVTEETSARLHYSIVNGPLGCRCNTTSTCVRSSLPPTLIHVSAVFTALPHPPLQPPHDHSATRTPPKHRLPAPLISPFVILASDTHQPGKTCPPSHWNASILYKVPPGCDNSPIFLPRSPY